MVDRFGTIDRFVGEFRFLSNFYLTPVRYEGEWYESSEAAYQAAKTLLPSERRMVREATSPAHAKYLGKHRITLRPNWERMKDDVMLEILRLKFKRQYLQRRLLETKNRQLVEGNFHHDNYWGDCRCRKCERFEGQNKLGTLLMKVRREIFRQGDFDDADSYPSRFTKPRSSFGR